MGVTEPDFIELYKNPMLQGVVKQKASQFFRKYWEDYKNLGITSRADLVSAAWEWFFVKRTETAPAGKPIQYYKIAFVHFFINLQKQGVKRTLIWQRIESHAKGVYVHE
jgi:hypothetical protein